MLQERPGEATKRMHVATRQLGPARQSNLQRPLSSSRLRARPEKTAEAQFDLPRKGTFTNGHIPTLYACVSPLIQGLTSIPLSKDKTVIKLNGCAFGNRNS